DEYHIQAKRLARHRRIWSMKVTRESLTEFRKDFKAAMAPLEEKYDITVKIGSITYNPDIAYKN
ncbi:MAG: hypothetical protein IJ073_01070, partial [Lachnospiraceae bacterium]|nr:hypothetical protein [Lachnospiraceae bacterium]